MTSIPRPAKRSALLNLVRIYALQTKYEFLKQLRIPVALIVTVAFPLMFYLLFSALFANQSIGGISLSARLLASYGALGMLSAALFGFGVGVSTERGQGWLRLQLASPMPPMAYFVAKLMLSLANGILMAGVLFLVGALLMRVDLSAGQWLSIGIVLVLGSLPFCAFGLVLGLVLSPASAPLVVNLLYLPMAFLSGLFFPLEALPGVLRIAAPYLPTYHYVQLVLQFLGPPQAGHSTVVSVVVLVSFGLLCLIAAELVYRFSENK